MNNKLNDDMINEMDSRVSMAKAIHDSEQKLQILKHGLRSNEQNKNMYQGKGILILMIIFILVSSYMLYGWHYIIKPSLPESETGIVIHISIIYIIFGVIFLSSSIIGFDLALEKESTAGVAFHLIFLIIGIIILTIGVIQYLRI